MNHLSSICFGINPRFMRSNSSVVYDAAKLKSVRAVGGGRIFQDSLVAISFGGGLGMARDVTLTLLLSRRASTTRCAANFFIRCSYHGFMKMDLRISIKNYRRGKT